MRVSKSTGKNDACPVSLIQRQFWVLHNFSPDSPAYNIPLVSVIKGDLNSDALETALNILLEKYRIFRAIFDLDHSGELIQRFAPWEKRTMPRVDLRPSEEGAVEKNHDLKNSWLKKYSVLLTSPPDLLCALRYFARKSICTF